MVTNLLFDQSGNVAPEEMDFEHLEKMIHLQVDELIQGCERCNVPVYIVTNELGMGIVPDNLLARRFRDIAGRVNQRLAAQAQQVYLVVSGIEVKIKG